MRRAATFVVNCNGKEVTLHAIDSLWKMTYTGFDLIILDYASTDGSPEALEQAFHHLKQFKVEINSAPQQPHRGGAGPARPVR